MNLVAHGITPIVTLYHYDMPVWVDEEFNGWYDRGIIDAFDQYVVNLASMRLETV